MADDPLDVNETHFHVCEACLHIWWHTTAESVIAGSRKAHKCPKCRAGPYHDGWRTMVAAVTQRGKLRGALNPAQMKGKS